MKTIIITLAILAGILFLLWINRGSVRAFGSAVANTARNVYNWFTTLAFWAACVAVVGISLLGLVISPLVGLTFGLWWAITLVVVDISSVSLAIYLLWFRTFRLPKLIKQWGEKTQGLTPRQENAWIPVEYGKKFRYGIFSQGGLLIEHPDQENQEIVVDNNPTSRNVWYPNDYTYFIEQLLARWVYTMGYFWIGFEAPNTRNIGELEIPASRLVGDQTSLTGKPLAEWVNVERKKIRHLRVRFPRALFFPDIETSDFFKVNWVIQCHIRVVNPWLLWYGLGGQAYGTMDKTIWSAWRQEAQYVSVKQLYTQRDDQEKSLMDKFKPIDGDDGLPKVEKMDFRDTIGIVVTQVELIEWEAMDATGLIEAGRRTAIIEQEEKAALRQVEKDTQVAKKSKTLVKAQTALQTKQVDLFEMRLATLKKFAGDDLEVLRAFLLKEQLGADFKAYVAAHALEKTNMTAAAFGDFFSSIIGGQQRPPPPANNQNQN